MRTPSHLHSFGDFWVWYGVTHKCRGWGKKRTAIYGWLAAPKGSGAVREAAVCLTGLKGRPGSTARRLDANRWQVTIPCLTDWGTMEPWKMHEPIYARTSSEALVLAEIKVEFAKRLTPSLTMVEGKLVSAVRKYGKINESWWEAIIKGKSHRLV